MAFPFGFNPPSIGQFIEKATQEYGATLVELNTIVYGPFGEIHPRILERVQDGIEYHVALPPLPDDVLITFHEARNLCDRLGIPTQEYGFILTDDGLQVTDPDNLN